MSLSNNRIEGVRSAVILHGLVHRSLRHVIESLRENVIESLARMGPVDVFFHSWDVAEVHNPRGGEHGVTVTKEDVARLLPEARGIFESQEAFDATVDWERLSLRNPMRHCCGSENEALASLMNFRRALESQERAWRFFEENRTERYDRVVATRGDLRFLEIIRTSNIELPTSNAGVGRIWLPLFHSWGGVNDRFAIGNEAGIGTWSQRVAFAEEWLGMADGESSEWLLKQWLEKHRVRVGFLDFVFQRVRADGKVAWRDRGLAGTSNIERPTPNIEGGEKTGRGPKNEKGGRRASLSSGERILILAREAGTAAERLRKVLDPLGKVEVVVDRPEDGVRLGELGAGSTNGLEQNAPATIWISDEEAEGYGGLMSKSGPFPRVTAWSRAFVHLARTLEEDEAVWFVEDDVAGNAEAFAELVRKTAAAQPDLAALALKTKHEDADWYWWGYAEEYFTDPCRGFQPLCRLSGRLVREVLNFRERHGKFTFHEVLFASVARAGGMRWLDWGGHAAFKHLFDTFRYRPELTAVRSGICHPLKDAALHEAVCAAPPAELPRMRQAKFDGRSILAEDYVFLSRHCRRYGISKVAEFGSGDSTLAFLDAGCRVACYEHDIGWLRESTQRFLGEDAVEVRHCPEGTVPEAGDWPFVPEMVFVDWPSFCPGQEMSRLQPCEWALESCGVFLLHDAKREGEQATLAEMERRGMSVTRIPTRKGLALVVDPRRRPEMVPETAEGMAERYRGETRGGWFEEDFCAWSALLREISQPVRVLETGAGAGVSLCLMLDTLFPHPASEAHGIGLYDGEAGERERQEFEANVKRSGHAGRLHFYEGTSREALAWMIAGEGFWESFDFIHLNGGGSAGELLTDACQAWALLKSRGVLALPGNGAGKAATDAFLSVFGDRLDRVLDGERVAVMKK